MYLLTVSSAAQAVSQDQQFSTLLKYSLSALEAPISFQTSVVLTANNAATITVPNLTKIVLLSVKSLQDVDISVKTSSGTDVYSGLPSTLKLIVSPTGQLFDHIKLRSAFNTTAEVSIAGLTT